MLKASTYAASKGEGRKRDETATSYLQSMETTLAILAAMASAMRGTHHPTICDRKGILFQCIPHSLIKNKVLAHLIAILTQLSAQKEVFQQRFWPDFR